MSNANIATTHSRNVLAIALSAAIVATVGGSLAPAAAATANSESDTAAEETATLSGTFSCNQNAWWSLTGSDLVISGSGPIESEEEIFNIADNVAHLYIEKGITSIGSDVFSFFPNLSSVTFQSESELRSIGLFSFGNCESLTFIEIPAAVTTIDTAAFSCCTALEKVAFSKESSLKTIGASAFNSCSSLRSIDIPASVSSIGNYAFNGCATLTSITIPANTKTVGQGAFEDCPKLSTVNVESPQKTSIAIDAFTGTTKAQPKTIMVKAVSTSGKGSLKIKWTKVSGATKYTIRIAASDSSSTKTVKTNSSSGTSKTIAKLKSGKRYKIKVTAMKGSKALCTSEVKLSPKVK